MPRKEEDYIIEYLDDYMNKEISLFKDDEGKFEQICIYLSDDDQTIRNKKLFIGNKFTTGKVNLFYEKHFAKDKFEIVEYYHNDVLDTYYKTDTNSKGKITIGYSNNHEPFYKHTLIFNKEDIPIAAKVEVLLGDNEIEIHYKRSNRDGKLGIIFYSSLEECILEEPVYID